MSLVLRYVALPLMRVNAFRAARKCWSTAPGSAVCAAKRCNAGTAVLARIPARRRAATSTSKKSSEANNSNDSSRRASSSVPAQRAIRPSLVTGGSRYPSTGRAVVGLMCAICKEAVRAAPRPGGSRGGRIWLAISTSRQLWVGRNFQKSLNSQCWREHED